MPIRRPFANGLESTSRADCAELLEAPSESGRIHRADLPVGSHLIHPTWIPAIVLPGFAVTLQHDGVKYPFTTPVAGSTMAPPSIDQVPSYLIITWPGDCAEALFYFVSAPSSTPLPAPWPGLSTHANSAKSATPCAIVSSVPSLYFTFRTRRCSNSSVAFSASFKPTTCPPPSVSLGSRVTPSSAISSTAMTISPFCPASPTSSVACSASNGSSTSKSSTPAI